MRTRTSLKSIAAASVLLFAASALTLSACGKTKTPSSDGTATPAAKVSIKSVSDDSVVAEVTLTACDCAYYTALPATQNAPTVAEIRKHNVLNQSGTVMVDELSAGTDYVFYVAPCKGNEYGKFATAAFKTTKLITPIAAVGWQTLASKTRLFAPVECATAAEAASNALRITVDTSVTYQTMEGFGPAITGSSAYNLLLMSQVDRTKLLKEVFDTREGMGYSFIRVSIGCSDFSLDEYTCCDTKGIENFEFNEYDRRDLLPVLNEIRAINPDIKILGSPWTCPKWMKIGTENSLPYNSWTSGRLNPIYYDDYALYFVKWIEYMEADGFPITAITIQNEPLNKGNSASMYMTWAEQRDFIVHSLAPAFAAHGIKTKIWCFDHNFDAYDYAVNLYKSEAAPYIDGSAWHAYGGSYTALSAVHAAAPTKGIYFTEQSIGTWRPDFGDNLMWTMHDICIGSVNLYCGAVMFWNFMLDSQRGPNRPGGCNTCYGFVDFADSGHQNLVRRSHYYAIAHMSKVVKTGAVRVASTGDRAASGIVFSAFANPDGTHSLVLLNESEGQTIVVYDGNGAFSFTAPRRSVTSLIW